MTPGLANFMESTPFANKGCCADASFIPIKTATNMVAAESQCFQTGFGRGESNCDC